MKLTTKTDPIFEKARAAIAQKNGSSINPKSYDFRYNIRNYLNFSRLLIGVTTALFTIMGTLYAFLYTPQYQGTALLSSKSYYSLSAEAKIAVGGIPVNDEPGSAQRALTLLQSPNLLYRLVDEENLAVTNKKSRGEMAREIADHLLVEAPGIDEKVVGNILKVTYTARDPENAAKITNHIAEIAVRESKAQEKEEAQALQKLLEAEVIQIAADLKEKESALAMWTQKLGQISLDPKIASTQVSDEWNALVAKLSDADANLALLSESVTPQNRLFREALAVKENLNEQKGALRNKVAQSLKASALVDVLQRDVALFSELYKTRVSHLEEIQARAAFPIGDLSILDAAIVPDYPSSLSRSAIILLSLFLGWITGYVVAVVFD